MARTTSAS